MKRRIEQLINGKYEYELTAPVLSVTDISAKCRPGDILTGSFDVSGGNDEKIKGFIYSSSPRMIFDPSQFSGNVSRITYQFDSTGLQDKDEAEGEFTLCTDHGEIHLPYHFSVESALQPEKPEAADPAELMALAMTDASKARQLFMSSAYEAYLKRTDEAHYLIYRSVVREDSSSDRSMEEYFVGCSLKQPVGLSLKEDSVVKEANDVSESGMLHLLRDGWGYLEITLESDAQFLRLEKRSVTTEDFVGDMCEIPYIIDSSFLHRGKNFGRICVHSCYQTLYLDVEIDKDVLTPEQMRASRAQKIMRMKFLNLYVDLRCKRVELQEWIDRSMNVISSYKRSGGQDLFADLFMVQLYYADGKRVKGYRLLQDIGKHQERFATEEEYGFYLYLTTFFERDEKYVDEVEKRIRRMFSQKKNSWVLQWIMLYLDEDLIKDDERKLSLIAGQVEYGCASPIMYLEAASIYRKNPYILRRLDSFECKVLLYAARQQMLTEELASHVGNLALQGYSTPHSIFQVLKACYEVAHSTDCLKAVCSVLIAQDKRESEYFRWYALAVQRELRLNGLYEYYMETMDEVGIEKMPQIIRMYFSYDNHLNYHKKAAIYRDISDNRDNVPQVYRQNRPAIERFVSGQLTQGRIDKNLAVLYERFITRKMLTETLAEHLVKLLFTFEVTCKNPHMKSVIVVHEHITAEQKVPLHHGRARVQIYTPGARIFLADDEGRRYASVSLYQAERYLDSPLLITYCRECLHIHPSLVLYYTGKGEDISDHSLPYYKAAEGMVQLTEDFRQHCRRKILAYYKENPLREDAYSYLKSIRYRDFMLSEDKSLLELLTREGLYEEAGYLLEAYGCEHLDASCLVRICSQNVLLREYEEDEKLLAYCYECYRCGKYDENILTYLMMYYDGPAEQMKRLWATGKAYELDTLLLEEKILSLVIFTYTGSGGTEKIFESYRHAMGRRRICLAYTVLKCYEYFVRNLPVHELIFRTVEEWIGMDMELEDVCRLALLQYYSGLPSLEGEREKTARTLLEEYSLKGMRFAFYKRFPAALRRDAQVDDRVFVEYVANPAHRMVLLSRHKGEEKFREQELISAFEGIFVREFVLFDDEVLECFAREYDGDTLVRESSLRTLSGAHPEEGDHSRYALLYRMSREAETADPDKLRAQLKDYLRLDQLTQKIFTLM